MQKNGSASRTAFGTIRTAAESKFGKAATLALIAMGSLSLAACAERGPTGTYLTDDTLETPRPTDPPKIEAMPESLAPYEAMLSAEFIELPLEERLVYCSYLNSDIAQIADAWYSITKDPFDLLPAAQGASVQDKMNISGYNIRGAFTAHNNGTLVYDQNTAEKILSCAFSDDRKDKMAIWMGYLNEAYETNSAGAPPQVYAQQGLLKASTVISSGEITVTNGLEMQIAEIIAGDGTNDTQPLYTVNYVDYKGQPAITYVG